MAKRSESPSVDEDMLRDAISRHSRNGSVTNTPIELPPQEPTATNEAEGDTTPALRRKRVILSDYEQTFLHNVEIHRRAVFYASEEMKQKYTEVVQLLGKGRFTLTSYVENILRHHLELYKDEINRLHKEQNSKNLI